MEFLNVSSGGVFGKGESNGGGAGMKRVASAGMLFSPSVFEPVLTRDEALVELPDVVGATVPTTAAVYGEGGDGDDDQLVPLAEPSLSESYCDSSFENNNLLTSPPIMINLETQYSTMTPYNNFNSNTTATKPIVKRESNSDHSVAASLITQHAHPSFATTRRHQQFSSFEGTNDISAREAYGVVPFAVAEAQAVTPELMTAQQQSQTPNQNAHAAAKNVPAGVCVEVKGKGGDGVAETRKSLRWRSGCGDEDSVEQKSRTCGFAAGGKRKILFEKENRELKERFGARHGAIVVGEAIDAEALGDLTGTTAMEARKMTQSERQVVLLKRKMRNRESARRSRIKKQAMLRDMNQEFFSLLDAAHKMKDTVSHLEAEVSKSRNENALIRSRLQNMQRV
mmetsp:Transcript_6583/g.14063  ORF Transcript_6583/g.14063 Transcript_6583/m.14063 type:complete len:396 (+) Transcript_6583:190-1377(+)